MEVTDEGQINWLLGIEIQQEHGTIRLRQTSYIKAVLEHFGLSNIKPTSASFKAKPCPHNNSKNSTPITPLSIPPLPGSSKQPNNETPHSTTEQLKQPFLMETKIGASTDVITHQGQNAENVGKHWNPSSDTGISTTNAPFPMLF
ncbi:hypothetical protein VNI00_017699 [Paramarasmius palmivorus]|uniref:Reverse transcriptase Ty1/copia-type domain-containing protein n=1 Tax=Paramarasmius palmivorus TaxID=297713 RepID=A0AAW0B3T5_9AGAR